MSRLHRKAPLPGIQASNALATHAARVYGPGAVERKRLYLRLGDRVYSEAHDEWGTGEVVEEMTSTVWGGTCLVRVNFDDGQQRTFHNDLDHEMCCYFLGIRREVSFDWDKARKVRGGPPSRKRLPED